MKHSSPAFLRAALAVSLVLAACSPQGDPAKPAETAAAAPVVADVPAAAVPALAADDPCRLLSDTDIRGVFPGSAPGKRETTREKYGIRACVWETESGSFALQRWQAKPGTAGDEIRGLAQGIIDPLKPAARMAVRYETVAGVGDEAVAIVETRDEARGILTDAAVLVALRGDRLIELHSSSLARGDRAAALKTLAALARTAVSRL